MYCSMIPLVRCWLRYDDHHQSHRELTTKGTKRSQREREREHEQPGRMAARRYCLVPKGGKVAPFFFCRNYNVMLSDQQHQTTHFLKDIKEKIGSSRFEKYIIYSSINCVVHPILPHCPHQRKIPPSWKESRQSKIIVGNAKKKKKPKRKLVQSNHHLW